MKKMKGSAFVKIILVVLAAVMCLCSCDTLKDAAKNAAGSIVESAKDEFNNAISEGKNELDEGANELKEALGEITSAVSEVSEGIGSEISEALGEVTNVSEQINSEVSEALGELTTASETTVKPEETAVTTSEPEKWYTFRNKTRYDEHFEKHGAEFGNITKEEYLQLANDLINSTSDRVLHKYSEDGDYMYFDQDTNHFLVLSEDGYIRTFFIPTAGINYWNRQ